MNDMSQEREYPVQIVAAHTDGYFLYVLTNHGKIYGYQEPPENYGSTDGWTDGWREVKGPWAGEWKSFAVIPREAVNAEAGVPCYPNRREEEQRE